MKMRTKSEEVQLDVATRTKSQEPHHYDEFMNVLHNRRYVWEKSEGSTLAKMARVETRSRSRSPQLAQKNSETYQYLGKRLAKEFKGKHIFR